MSDQRDTANEAIYFEGVGLLGGPDPDEQNALLDGPSAFADEDETFWCEGCGEVTDEPSGFCVACQDDEEEDRPDKWWCLLCGDWTDAPGGRCARCGELAIEPI